MNPLPPEFMLSQIVLYLLAMSAAGVSFCGIIFSTSIKPTLAWITLFGLWIVLGVCQLTSYAMTATPRSINAEIITFIGFVVLFLSSYVSQDLLQNLASTKKG